MNRITCVKAFFDKDTERPVSNREFMDFWKALSEEERQQFADDAAKALGVVLDA